MFVLISALSAGRCDATLWSLYWMSASALKSNITQLCTFFFTFTFFLFVLSRRNSLHEEASMGCVRETPHLNQHWACKRNSPYKPAWVCARGAPCVTQHRVCKTKKKSPCKAAWDCKRNSQQKELPIMECVKESHQLAQGSQVIFWIPVFEVLPQNSSVLL